MCVDSIAKYMYIINLCIGYTYTRISFVSSGVFQNKAELSDSNNHLTAVMVLLRWSELGDTDYSKVSLENFG